MQTQHLEAPPIESTRPATRPIMKRGWFRALVLSVAALVMAVVAYVGLTHVDTGGGPCVDMTRANVLLQRGVDNSKVTSKLWDLYLQNGKRGAAVVEGMVTQASTTHELAVLWKDYPAIANRIQSASRWYDQAATEMTNLDPNEHKVASAWNRGNTILRSITVADYQSTHAPNCK